MVELLSHCANLTLLYHDLVLDSSNCVYIAKVRRIVSACPITLLVTLEMKTRLRCSVQDCVDEDGTHTCL